MDEGAIKSFAEQSHKLGLNNKQAEGILNFYKSNMEGTAQQAKIDTETAQSQSEQELRQEWGRDFEGKVKQAGALAKASASVNFSMFGSFLYSSLIESFQDGVGCAAGVAAGVVGCAVSVVACSTGTVSCVICSFDIFIFPYLFVALI